MTPGLHKDIPAEIYHALPHVSNSRLSLLADCPARLKHEMDHPSEQTEAMKIGEALHTLVLQPHLYEGKFAVAGRCEGITNKGERCSKGGTSRKEGGWYCSQHWQHAQADDIAVLTESQADQIVGMYDAAKAHAGMNYLLRMKGDVEITGIFDDPDTGIRCKMRIDKLIQDEINGVKVVAAMDLKKVRPGHANPKLLPKRIAEYEYDRQACFYLHGLAQLGIVADTFWFGFIEEEPYHGVSTKRLVDRALARVRPHIVRDLFKFQECQKTGVWPGYSETIDDIDVPEYIYRQEQ